MKFRVLGDYFSYWVDASIEEMEQRIYQTQRAYKCRDFYVKRRIKQVFDIEGNLVYQA